MDDRRRKALTRQVARLDRRIDALKRRSTRLSWARLWTFLATPALAFVVAIADLRLGAALLVAGLALFALVVLLHRRTDGAVRRCSLWRDDKQAQLARQALEWDALPPPLDDPPQPNHPFEFDLDITGPRSLHHVLDTPATRDGSRRLRDWLLTTTPQPDVISTRRDRVRELITRPLFVGKLGLAGRLAGRGQTRWESAALHQWLAEPIPTDRLGLAVILLALLACFTLPLALANAAGLLPPYWVIPFLLYFALSVSRLPTFFGVFEEATLLQDSLRPLQSVFAELERQRYAGSALAALCAPFRGDVRPSRLLRRVGFVVSASSIQRNVLLWLLLNAAVPWDLFFAYQLRIARRRLRDDLPQWLDVWFELEALSALATFAYLNPAYPFPTLAAQPLRFQAHGIGHPLIAHDRRVTNDFTLIGLGQVALITGSNMSGKSTFLRTVGVNMVLAYAGSVVTAQSLSLPYCRLYTAVRINDSLAEGISYFYAEVRRLKALLDALRQPDALPLFFLIDEIFRGTNNRERLIGSRAYIQALVGAGNGMGVVSTHDLELTSLAGEHVHNYHFADRVEDQRMAFDYRLQSGPSVTTNALRIMAMEGLPVPPDE